MLVQIQSQTDKLEAEVYKKRIMQLAARINAELARVRLAEKRGHDDKSDVLQVCDLARALSPLSRALSLLCVACMKIRVVVWDGTLGDHSRTGYVQAKLQQHAQQFDLQHERDMLVALNSVIGKYQALAAVLPLLTPVPLPATCVALPRSVWPCCEHCDPARHAM